MRVAAILACLVGAEAAACLGDEAFPAGPEALLRFPHEVDAPRLEPSPSGGEWDLRRIFEAERGSDGPPQWMCLPDGLLYNSYAAGEKEPRFSTAWLHDLDGGWFWDATLGGRAGVLRYQPAPGRREAWQLDIEGAAMVRLDMEQSEDLRGVDFRFGVPLTWRDGPLALKAGYYHLSSHVGDEFLLRNPGFDRINYVRESLVFGVARDLGTEWMAYAELGYAFKVSGDAKPLEFQFGAQYDADPHGWRFASPFAAVNFHLREEVDFGGSVNLLTGFLWSDGRHERAWRAGLQLFHGKSAQYSFFRRTETLVGLGMWYDY
ncbi:MAG: DUF1207 domain-containing protein [Planctomycetales bacterium]